jgi:hypothetical protein
MSDRIHVVPDTMQGVMRMAFGMKRAFERAEAEGNEIAPLMELIDDPEALAAEARGYCLTRLRESNLMHPIIFLMSRGCAQVAMLQHIPDELHRRAALVAPLRVLIATSAVAAYWLAGEIWFATGSPDAAVNALMPREREHKREGVIIISASRTNYRARIFETVRDGNGVVSDLVDVGPGEFMAGVNLIYQNWFDGADDLRASALASLARQL